MADRQIINTRDDSSSAAAILLGVFVVALVLLGLWYASRHTSVITTPGIPNTGSPSTQIHVSPNGGSVTPSPSPTGR